jgi:hypothetical protein
MCSRRSACCSASRKPSRQRRRAIAAAGVTAKDLILAIIGKIGVAGGTGHVLEYRGAAIRALSMDERMTVCNMSIEAGARAGMIAPDETTFAYLEGRRARPRAGLGRERRALAHAASSDPGAHSTRGRHRRRSLEPMITYGTNPGMVLPIRRSIPQQRGDPVIRQGAALHGISRRRAMLGKPVDVVFIGSCTNGRLEDLQARRKYAQGPQGRAGVRLLIVPGSQQSSARPKRRARRDFQGGRRRLARVGLLDVPGHERRHGRRRASIRSAPATAISRAARASARAPCWRARSPRRRAPCAAGSPIRGRCCNAWNRSNVRSRTVVMPSTNIDTDQIIPARFLTTTTKEGLGKQLFADWRYRPTARRIRISS